jgi:hypothetical protein
MRCCFLYSKDNAFYQQRVAKTISSAAHQLRIFDAHPPNQDVRSFDSIWRRKTFIMLSSSKSHCGLAGARKVTVPITATTIHSRANSSPRR